MSTRSCTTLEPGQLIKIAYYGALRNDLSNKVVMYLNEGASEEDPGFYFIEVLVDDKIEKLQYKNLSYSLVK